MYKQFIFLFLCLKFINIFTMECQLNTQDISQEFIGNLPRELQVEILKLLASHDTVEFIQNLSRVSRLNKSYYNFIYSPEVLGKIILNFKPKTNLTIFQIVLHINHPNAFLWLKNYILNNRKIFTDQILKKELFDDISNNNTKLVALLLSLGIIDINRKDQYGQTPLIRAVNCLQRQLDYIGDEPDIDMLKILLAQPNINVNAITDLDSNQFAGYSALRLAIQCGLLDIVALLLEFPGIDVTTINPLTNETVLGLAKRLYSQRLNEVYVQKDGEIYSKIIGLLENRDNFK